MNQFKSNLKDYILHLNRQYGDTDVRSILEMTYQFYTEYNPIDNDEIRHQFHTLEPFFDHLTPEENDIVFDIICRLCSTHERLAFLEGLHVGARLILDLED